MIKEKSEVPEMSVTSALQVQEALLSRYLTTLFSHLHHEPPPGYNRCSVSQLVAADKLVWQILLEEGIQPKRDESGTLALVNNYVIVRILH